MYHEVKIPVNEILNEKLDGQSPTVRDLIIDKAMNIMLSDESVTIDEMDIAKPVIITRGGSSNINGYFVIHFYPVSPFGVDEVD